MWWPDALLAWVPAERRVACFMVHSLSGDEPAAPPQHICSHESLVYVMCFYFRLVLLALASMISVVTTRVSCELL